MSVRTALIVSLIASLIAIATASGTAQAPSGSVRGEVRDGSDSVVPGVTVELAVAARVIGVAVTGTRGDFGFDAVPAGPVTLRLSLEGFQPAALRVDVVAGLETVASGVLEVAPLSERVVVR
ncbi:MAG: carboxypeptidase-like regulatory domain-containing protein, partial [Vicinamibacterales bacterium]